MKITILFGRLKIKIEKNYPQIFPGMYF